MTWQIWALVAGVAVLVIALLVGAMGCTQAGVLELEARHKAIQDCILSGGHARLGPDNTIWCD